MQWGGVAVVAVLAGVLLYVSGGFQFVNPRLVVAATASTSPTASPTATETPAAPGLTETAAAAFATPSREATPAIELPEIPVPEGGQVYVVTPAPDAVGWVREGDDSPNHLGDYNIYAGVFGGQRHLGAIQFDLSGIPPGAPIAYADLTLLGLEDGWLGMEGAWMAQLLEPWWDADWAQLTFFDLVLPDGAAADLEPTLGPSDLAAGRPNRFVLGPQARQVLESRTLTGQVSFRIVGPASGADSLFAWDSGYGSRSRGWKPLLRIGAGPAPLTLPAAPTAKYVVITGTPTPENIVTAAAAAATATAQAATTGTPTPLPPNWVTPVIVVPTPTPANAATAQWHAALATAEVLLYGTPTPLPANVWTATPRSYYVVVTNTPTPAIWATAVAQAVVEATRRAGGWAPTRLPPYWATETPVPVYRLITSTPAPQNGATATAISAQATIVALSMGTATPLPANWVTATPVPLTIPFSELTPTPTPAPTPSEIPGFLRGKIAFLSDRLGRTALFVMDPDGSNVAWLTLSYPYDLAEQREARAPDAVRRAVVQKDEGGRPQLFVTLPDGTTQAITSLPDPASEPAWSPVADRIVFVYSLPGNDEVYAVNADGSELARITDNGWQWDRHPSWSPDGTQIAFYSIRDSARRQIWIMNADGSDQTNISENQYNDWDPIWLK